VIDTDGTVVTAIGVEETQCDRSGGKGDCVSRVNCAPDRAILVTEYAFSLDGVRLDGEHSREE